MADFATALPPGARVLITGGSGFIGTNLVDFYLRQGLPVRSLDLAAPRDPTHAPVWRKVDLLDAAGLKAALAEFAPTHVLHFGARTDLDGPTLNDYAANHAGTQNILAAVEAVPNLSALVVASSMLVCRLGHIPRDELDVCPATIYGQSKVLAERAVRDSRVPAPWTIVRPTSIWGPWFAAPYRQFFEAVSSGRYAHPGARGAVQTYGYVGNTVFEIDRIAAAGAELTGRTFYLGDFPALNLREWADAIAAASGGRRLRSLPLPLLRVVALGGDLLERLKPGLAPLTSFRLANMTTDNDLNLDGLAEVVGGTLPYSTEQGVSETLAWLDAQR